MKSKHGRGLDRAFAAKRAQLDALKAPYIDLCPNLPDIRPEHDAFESDTAYGAYLQSNHWRVLRMSTIAKRGSSCEVCKVYLKQPQIHHLNYDRLGHERETDILIACNDCHRRYHGIPTTQQLQAAFKGQVTKCPPAPAKGIRPEAKRRPLRLEYKPKV